MSVFKAGAKALLRLPVACVLSVAVVGCSTHEYPKVKLGEAPLAKDRMAIAVDRYRARQGAYEFFQLDHYVVGKTLLTNGDQCIQDNHLRCLEKTRDYLDALTLFIASDCKAVLAEGRSTPGKVETLVEQRKGKRTAYMVTMQLVDMDGHPLPFLAPGEKENQVVLIDTWMQEVSKADFDKIESGKIKLGHVFGLKAAGETRIDLGQPSKAKFKPRSRT